MILAKMEGWFSKSFSLYRDDEFLAKISLSSLKESASFVYQNREIEISKASTFKSDYFLKLNGATLAKAQKKSVWSYDTLITVSDQEFLLTRKKWYCRDTSIIYSGREIGTITPTSIWSRNAKLDVPQSIPIEIQIFALVITYFYWQRDNAAAGGGS